MRTIWLNLEDEEDTEGKADAIVKTFAEVLDVVKRWIKEEGEGKTE